MKLRELRASGRSIAGPSLAVRVASDIAARATAELPVLRATPPAILTAAPPNDFVYGAPPAVPIPNAVMAFAPVTPPAHLNLPSQAR